MNTYKKMLVWVLAPNIFFSLLFPAIVTAQDNRPVVVLSPGHGWTNGDSIASGATSGDLVEKDINLEVAKYARTYLKRCDIVVYLTREGDDPDHTLSDVSEIVNNYNPTIGISIHTNSGEGNPTGTESWYTVGGFYDNKSQLLGTLLTNQISSRMGISNRGIKPETENRHGGLNIHNWNAPSALIELAFLQGDADLLRNRRDDFGRAVAQAALEYLKIDPHCADWAIPEGIFIATYFQMESKINEIRIKNDGLMSWDTGEYVLINKGKSFGAKNSYPLIMEIPVNQVLSENLPAVAPSKAGVYRQTWQLERGSEFVGDRFTVYLIVVPEEARQLKKDLDRRIEELRVGGEQEIEDFLEQLEEEAMDWVIRELPNLVCGQQLMLISVALGALIGFRKYRA